MDLQDVHDLVNFYINKAQGSYLSPEEVDDMLHVWQISYYNDLHSKSGTSEDIDNSLSTFLAKYTFDETGSPLGVVTLPDNYFDLEALELYIQQGTRTVTRPIDFPNLDELAYIKSSQLRDINTDPCAEIKGKGVIQIYPKTPFSGEATYYRLPVKPIFVYTLISGRIVQYNAGASTQLEWLDSDVNTIVIRALSGVGINISAEDVQNWSNTKAIQNQTGPIKT